MTQPHTLPSGCGYTAYPELFPDGGHMGCYGAHLYIVDGQATPLHIPCPRCNTAAMIAHIFAQSQSEQDPTRLWKASDARWEDMITTAFQENPQEALHALEALGPQRFCTNNSNSHREQHLDDPPVFRAWPWPIPKVSHHLHLRLIAIGTHTHPLDTPP